MWSRVRVPHPALGHGPLTRPSTAPGHHSCGNPASLVGRSSARCADPDGPPRSTTTATPELQMTPPLTLPQRRRPAPTAPPTVQRLQPTSSGTHARPGASPSRPATVARTPTVGRRRRPVRGSPGDWPRSDALPTRRPEGVRRHRVWAAPSPIRRMHVDEYEAPPIIGLGVEALFVRGMCDAGGHHGRPAGHWLRQLAIGSKVCALDANASSAHTFCCRTGVT